MTKKCYLDSVVCIVAFCIGIFVFSFGLDDRQVAYARSEQFLDGTNNNLVISLDAPGNWNSGIISESISDLNWRLNALNVINGDTKCILCRYKHALTG